MRNKKGFTLIEIMIVVAIIGILALVLVPKIGGMKDSAKLSGIDTNLRVAQGTIEGMLSNFKPDSSDTSTVGAKALEEALATKLAAVENPLTGSAGVKTSNPDNGDAAFWYSATDELDSVVGAPVDAGTDKDFKGAIFFSSYVVNNELTVKLTPYDQNGLAITAKELIIKK